MSKIRRIFKGGEDGFTLIELLVVIAVLGILAAIAIPRLGGVTDKAKIASMETFASTVRNVEEMYFTENGYYIVPNASNSGDSFTTDGGLGQYLNTPIPKEFYISSTTDGSTASSYKIVFTHHDNSNLTVTISEGGLTTSLD